LGTCVGAPELGGSAGGLDLLAVSTATACEHGECLLELGAGAVALEQVAQLCAGQPGRGVH